jgi:hypothetical protein
MGRHPAALFPLVTAGLALLPGCVVVPAAPADPPAPARTSAAGHRFKEYAAITGPGQRLTTGGVAQAAAPSVGPPVPIPDPPAAPAPLATTVSAVQPPSAEPRIALSPPPPADHPLLAAIRAYLDNRPDQAVEHLRGLDPANQDLVLRLIPAVVHAQRARPRDAADMTVLAAEVGAAADAAARVAPLRIGKACFVESVKQFGVYTPMPPGYAYLPGGAAVLYVEVPNAPSHPTPHPGGGDGYVTRLDCELRLHDGAGKLLARFDPANAPDMAVKEYTRSPIRDLFLRFQFQVPNAPGAYAAEFVVRDPATGRAARKVVEVRVAGP